MQINQAISLIIGILLLILYSVSCIFVYRLRDLRHIAQRSWFLSMVYILLNLLVVEILIFQFIIYKKNLNSFSDQIKYALEAVYGFCKFTMLLVYFMRCMRLVVAFVKNQNSWLFKIFKCEKNLIAFCMSFSVALVIISLLSDKQYIFVNNLLRDNCPGLTSFVLLASIMFAVFVWCFYQSLKVNQKFSFKAQIISIFLLYVLTFNLQVLVEYPKSPKVASNTRDWLWYWGVIILNFFGFFITVLMPIIKSLTDKQDQMFMPMKFILHDFSLFRSVPQFKSIFIKYLNSLKEDCSDALKQFDKKVYRQHGAFYLTLNQQILGIEKQVQSQSFSQSMSQQSELALNLFQKRIKPFKSAFNPDIYKRLNFTMKSQSISRECFRDLQIWMNERLNIFYNQFKFTRSYQTILQLLEDNQRINKNMVQYGMIL